MCTAVRLVFIILVSQVAPQADPPSLGYFVRPRAVVNQGPPRAVMRSPRAAMCRPRAVVRGPGAPLASSPIWLVLIAIVGGFLIHLSVVVVGWTGMKDRRGRLET